MRFRNIGSAMDMSSHLSTGFDYTRLFLASAVFIWHAWVFTHTNREIADFMAGPGGNAVYAILPAFFALSGVLVMSSLIRTKNISIFIRLRILRIFPALMTVTVITALLIGPLSTSVDLSEYFSSRDFHLYFLNGVGMLKLWLPGVFVENQAKGIVNASMWTIAWEFKAYVLLAIFSYFSLLKHPRFLAVLFLTGLVLATIYCHFYRTTHNPFDHFSGAQLVLFFMAGAILYINRDIVPDSPTLAVAAFFSGLALAKHPTLFHIAIPLLAYAIFWIGVQRPLKNFLVRHGDFSYGIYLYGGPVQQLVWQYSDWGRGFWANLLISSICTAPFAAFSWYAIEKPALAWKKSWSPSSRGDTHAPMAAAPAAANQGRPRKPQRRWF